MQDAFEAIIGFVVILISGLFVFHILELSKTQNIESSSTKIYAKFMNIDGIKSGTDVKIGGLKVGYVKNLEIKKENFQILVSVIIRDDIKIPVDSVLAVASSGIFGSKYLAIRPGFEETYIKNGEFFENTQSSMNLEDLISKFVSNK